MSLADPLGGWTVHQDDQGRTFYHNASSGESSWTVPEGLLPEGWSAHADPGGKVFYHNVSDGTTQWEHPSHVAPEACSGKAESFAFGTTTCALQCILGLVVMVDMATLLGDEKVQRIQLRAQCLDEALALPATDPKAISKIVAAGRDLAKVCLRVRAFNVSPYVAELVCATTAAIAGLIEPGMMPGGRSLDDSQAMKLMQVFAECQTTTFLLDAASALNAAFFDAKHADGPIQRIRAAFSGTCGWLLSAFCRTVGYNKLSAALLWEWANSDPMWIAVLTKGTLTLDKVSLFVPESKLIGPFFQPEFNRIQNALLNAVLGLLAHNIVFYSLDSNSKAGTSTSEISEPNVRFACHRSKIAVAIVECDLVGDILKSLQGDAKAQFVAFVANILQPELHQSPAWARDVPHLVEAAKAASINVAHSLHLHAQVFWEVLATVPSAGQSPRSFLKDCSVIAYCFPYASPDVAHLIRGTLSCTSELGSDVISDLITLTSLCILAANADIVPDSEDDGGLSYILSSLPTDSRLSILGQLSEWTGIAAQTACACWAALLQGIAPPLTSALPRWKSTGFTSAHRRTLGVVCLAPSELCCAVDRMLLEDPIRSPYGHSFEYAVLERTLSQNKGVCPITDKPLTLSSCWRDDELRQRVSSWLQQRQPM